MGIVPAYAGRPKRERRRHKQDAMALNSMITGERGMQKSDPREG